MHGAKTEQYTNEVGPYILAIYMVSFVGTDACHINWPFSVSYHIHAYHIL